LFLLLLFFITLAPSSGQLTGYLLANLRASGDTYISFDISSFNESREANFGSSGELRVGFRYATIGTAAQNYTLLKFDLFDRVPPGAEVASAKLYLTVRSPPSDWLSVEVHGLTMPFSEDSATWSSHGDYCGSFITRNVITFDAHSGDRVEFDVTDYMRNLVSGGTAFPGFCLAGALRDTQREDGMSFYSREAGYPPTLVISFRNPTIEFDVSSMMSIRQGETRQYPVMVTGTFKGEASLSYEWVGSAPPGVSISFSPSRGRVAFPTSMTVSVPSGAPAGSYRLRIRAQNT